MSFPIRLLTFGLYVIYSLYLFSKKLNKKIKPPISTSFMNIAILIHCISLTSLIIHFSVTGLEYILVFSKFMHLLSSLFHIIWILKVRNRINQINGVKRGDHLWLNPILSSFLHIIYIQYKINESILSKA